MNLFGTQRHSKNNVKPEFHTKLINNLKYAANLANIGDTRTLVIHPMSTIYAFNNEKEIESAGVYDDLIRVSVGIEDIEDLIEDFKQALEKIY